jgi:hypothetical protein
MANTLHKFYEKLVIAFSTANKKILNRIHCEIRTNELVVTIRSEKQGLCNCINASVISVRPDKTHKMMVEEIMVGFDSEGSPWSDHMGGTIVDCSGLNVQGAIEKIVDGMNEHI